MGLKELMKKANGWLKQPHNLFFLLIILLALIIRVYFFSQTMSQPLWWDEAEYMTMAKAWAFNMDYTFLPVRPVLLSSITAFFFKMSYSEFLPRMFVMLLSMASVAGMYCLGKEFYNKKVALLASFLMAVFWLDIFFSMRLLVDSISLTFFIFSTLFFYKYLKNNSKKALYMGSAIIAIGVLFRLSTGIFLVCLLLYLLFTQKLAFVKKKELWISGLIFLLILSPYVIWGYMQFDGFVITKAAAWNAPDEFTFENLWWNSSSYFKSFPTYLSWPLLIVFLAGLVSFYKVLVGFDMIFKGKGGSLNKELFLILLFLIPILFTSNSFYHHIENRYIITAFPAIFIIAGSVLTKFYNSMKRNKQKTLAIILIALFLGYIAYFQATSANSLIQSKADSYGDVKRAGEWIDENLDESASIITKSWPQIMYYSNRNTIKMNKDNDVFLQQLQALSVSDKASLYFIINAFEPHEQWILSYPQENNLSAVYVSFFDPQKSQPSLIIYNMSSPSQSSL